MEQTFGMPTNLDRNESSSAIAQLWVVDLDGSTHEDPEDWLSTVELQRAARFIFARDARRYLASHVTLRRLLQSSVGIPARLEFAAGAHGKPHIDASWNCRFNLSRSSQLALIGIGRCGGYEIGVDIEVVRSIDDCWELAERHFTPAERVELAHAASGKASRAFLTGWTRKEACLKAIGTGLSIAPDAFEVGLASDSRHLSIETDDGLMDVRVQTISAGEDAVAAVASARRQCYLNA